MQAFNDNCKHKNWYTIQQILLQYEYTIQYECNMNMNFHHTQNSFGSLQTRKAMRFGISPFKQQNAIRVLREKRLTKSKLSAERDACGDSPGGDVTAALATATGEQRSGDTRGGESRAQRSDERSTSAASPAAPRAERGGSDAGPGRGGRTRSTRDQPGQPTGPRHSRLSQQLGR